MSTRNSKKLPITKCAGVTTSTARASERSTTQSLSSKNNPARLANAWTAPNRSYSTATGHDEVMYEQFLFRARYENLRRAHYALRNRRRSCDYRCIQGPAQSDRDRLARHHLRAVREASRQGHRGFTNSAQ